MQDYYRRIETQQGAEWQHLGPLPILLPFVVARRRVGAGPGKTSPPGKPGL